MWNLEYRHLFIDALQPIQAIVLGECVDISNHQFLILWGGNCGEGAPLLSCGSDFTGVQGPLLPPAAGVAAAAGKRLAAEAVCFLMVSKEIELDATSKARRCAQHFAQLSAASGEARLPSDCCISQAAYF